LGFKLTFSLIFFVQRKMEEISKELAGLRAEVKSLVAQLHAKSDLADGLKRASADQATWLRDARADAEQLCARCAAWGGPRSRSGCWTTSSDAHGSFRGALVSVAVLQAEARAVLRCVARSPPALRLRRALLMAMTA
jgi:hypothetical protein